MKKIILIMLLTIPVIVTLLVYMIAGFIIREVAYVDVTHISINYENAFNAGLMSVGDDEDRNFEVSGMRVGDQIDLTQIITVNPSRAQFTSLRITVSYEGDENSRTTTIYNNEYGLIMDGIIRAMQTTNNAVVIRILNANAVGLMTVVIDGISPAL